MTLVFGFLPPKLGGGGANAGMNRLNRTVLAVLQDFLIPHTQAVAQGKKFELFWSPSEFWQSDNIL